MSAEVKQARDLLCPIQISTEKAIEDLIEALNCMATYGLEHPEYLAARDLAYHVFPLENAQTEAGQLRARITDLETALDRCIDALADARSSISGGLFPDDIAERDAYRAILERKV